MKARRVQFFTLLAIVLFAGALRLHALRDLPAGLFCDEAAMGYNAHAIATAGIDETGKPWPLFFWSFSGFKNPSYIYAAAIPVYLFGLDEFTTRLPAALYGTATILAIFFLGRALYGPGVGLIAAFLLAITPWHLHMSRIAFELIAFPLWVTFGTLFLVHYARGRRTLAPALFFFALTPYTYAIAGVFVPLFLTGFGLLFLPSLIRRWKETLLAFAVMLATLAPAVNFHYANQEGMGYVGKTSWVDLDAPLPAQFERFAENYREFVSPKFLFESGDPIVRHAVRGFGQLLPLQLPESLGIPAPWRNMMLGLLLLGAAVALLRFDRASWLLLWWLALFPVSASLMTEIPSATRSFIGVAAFALIAALGLATLLRLLGWIGRVRPVRIALQGMALAGFLYLAGTDTYRYLDHYYNEYNAYAAPHPGGFQYGFREAIEYMESVRDQYDLLMISTTDGNQNQIFPLFYRAVDPREWRRTHDPGYLILVPTEYHRYSLDQRVLYALQRSDLDVFSDYEIKHRVVAPGGQEAFLIAEVRQRKQYVTDWLVLGPFDNEGGKGVQEEFIDINDLKRQPYRGAFGNVEWRRIRPQFVYVDLNTFYASDDPPHYRNPEYLCAYAMTTITSPSARTEWLELGGSDDFIEVWLNGVPLTSGPMMLGERVKRRPVELRAGTNVLVAKSCETVGSWRFTVRFADDDGRDLTDLVVAANLPRERIVMPEVVAPPVDPVQLVEGFASVVRAPHSDKHYVNYRGGAEAWWSYVRNVDGEVVWRTAPLPERKVTTVVFAASMGEESGLAELWIDGRFALDFELGRDVTTRTWQAGPYQLSFAHRAVAGGNSGVFLLTVPPEAMRPGEPLELRVAPVDGHEGAWFMVQGHRDTILHEQLTPEGVVDGVRQEWKEVE